MGGVILPLLKNKKTKKYTMLTETNNNETNNNKKNFITNKTKINTDR